MTMCPCTCTCMSTCDIIITMVHSILLQFAQFILLRTYGRSNICSPIGRNLVMNLETSSLYWMSNSMRPSNVKALTYSWQWYEYYGLHHHKGVRATVTYVHVHVRVRNIFTNDLYTCTCKCMCRNRQHCTNNHFHSTPFFLKGGGIE